MPQNIRDSDTTGGVEPSDSAAIGAAALERLRTMYQTPVANRPADWINPLEKIEQLLTCSICLDRYKNPKLLPCQHTFCMEPCLDGLIDLVRRTVRCPECRAESPLPYDGLKGLQTNYTLMGFLEIHLAATEENAGDLESYIRRYNLERCKICDEKAEVDYCPHCEKRICLECKATHADMLKRDLGRLMNQVKRACSRIVDSSDTLARGVDSLNVNCENVKEEVRDYMRRYMKELKKREDALITEVEAFYSGETRMINTVRDNLELEAKNMNEACARVESCLKGEKELNDDELVRYKTMFTEGLDYLRMANPDADELINKKIRFVITDAHILPHAIVQFGELQVCTPQFSHKFVQAEKMYVPRFLQLGMESDNYPGKKRLDQNETPTAPVATTVVPSWKQPKSTAHDEDAYSSRYRRRQLLEEQAWNRVRVEQEQSPQGAPMRRSPRGSGLDEVLGGTSPSRANNLDAGSPWRHRATSDLTPESITVVASNVADSLQPTARIAQAKQQPRSGVAEAAAGSSSSGSQNATSRISSRQLEPESQGENQDRELDKRVANIRKEYERRQQEQEENLMRVTQKRERNRTAPLDVPAAGARGVGGHSSEEEDENDEDEEGKIQVQMFPRDKQGAKTQQSVATSRPLHVDTNDASTSRDPAPAAIEPSTITNTITGAGADWRKYLIPSPTPEIRYHGRRSSTAAADLTSGLNLTTGHSSTGRLSDHELRSSSSRDSDLENAAEMEERRRHFIRSKTNPDFSVETPESIVRPVANPNLTDPLATERRRRARTDSTGSQDGGRNSNDETSTPHHGTHTKSEREAEQRKNRYRRKAERSHSAYVGIGAGNEDGQDGIAGMEARINDGAQRFEISIQGNAGDSPGATSGGARFYRVFTQPKIEYLSKGRCLGKFGAKGQGEAQFNWPRGIAIVPTTEEIAVCDSSNHRMQIFDKRGRFVKTIGSYGSSRGEFDCLADVCINKYGQFVVTDRYNHRVQIFDANGRHLREFGAHGQTNGRFNSPWGIVVDQQGFIYVCDKDNHRVQIFQADGNFVGKFGGMGNREGQFQNPHFIACNRHNQLIVSDSSNHRVQVFDHNGHFLFAFGSEGFHEGQFKHPRGVSVDEQGFIVVADSGNNRIQVFYPDGRFYTMMGTWGTGDGQLKGVEGVVVGLDGRIIVTDRENHRVQIF